jgi:hypothetical protein
MMLPRCGDVSTTAQTETTAKCKAGYGRRLAEMLMPPLVSCAAILQKGEWMIQIYSFLIVAFGGVLFISLYNKQRSMRLIPLSVADSKQSWTDLSYRRSEPGRLRQSGTVNRDAPVV